MFDLHRAMWELALRDGTRRGRGYGQVHATHLTRDHVDARHVASRTAAGPRPVGMSLAARHAELANDSRPDAALLACLKGGCSEGNAHGLIRAWLGLGLGLRLRRG